MGGVRGRAGGLSLARAPAGLATPPPPHSCGPVCKRGVCCIITLRRPCVRVCVVDAGAARRRRRGGPSSGAARPRTGRGKSRAAPACGPASMPVPKKQSENERSPAGGAASGRRLCRSGPARAARGAAEQSGVGRVTGGAKMRISGSLGQVQRGEKGLRRRVLSDVAGISARPARRGHPGSRAGQCAAGACRRRARTGTGQLRGECQQRRLRAARRQRKN